MLQRAFMTWLKNNIKKPNAISSGRIKQSADDKYLVVNKLDRSNPLDHDGVAGNYTAFFQLDAYAKRKEDAQDIIEEARKKLNGFSGYFGDYKISGAEISNEKPDYHDEEKLYREQFDIKIPY